MAPNDEERAEDSPDRAQADLRRRLDAVFGDVLPSVTRDERDDDEPRAGSGDDDLLADRPPHHDRE